MLSTIIAILILIFVSMLALIYWIISRLKAVFNNSYYLVFKGLDINRKQTAIISASFIIGLCLILIFASLNLNLVTYNNQSNLKPSNKISLNISVEDERKTEVLLNGDNKKYQKYYIHNARTESINGEKMENIIDNRFTTSEELRKDYREYAQNLTILANYKVI